MPALYNWSEPGPGHRIMSIWSTGYFLRVYRNHGGLLDDLVSTRYVSFDEIVWC